MKQYLEKLNEKMFSDDHNGYQYAVYDRVYKEFLSKEEGKSSQAIYPQDYGTN